MPHTQVRRIGIFNVRTVLQGDRYGLNDCLTHDTARPMIEFYDARQDPEKFGERGQFVSRYYAETLKQAVSAGHGVMLDSGSPDWFVTHLELAKAIA
jgi:hypothetical protein